VNAPAIVGESVLLNLLPEGPHTRPVTLRAVSPCMLWVLTIRDLEHILKVSTCTRAAPFCVQGHCQLSRLSLQVIAWPHLLNIEGCFQRHLIWCFFGDSGHSLLWSP
jgi:hypothetical protein